MGVVPLAVVVPLIVAVLAQAPAAADDGGPGLPPSPTMCFTSDSNLRKVIFPVGGTPPALPYPEVHQLTTEYQSQGLVFSDSDSDLSAAFKKLNQAPQSYNLVRQQTLTSFYRVNFVGNDVFQISLTLEDTNPSVYTINKLDAFSANGTLLASTIFRDGQTAQAGGPYPMAVRSTGDPIKSIVFTQQDIAGTRVDTSMILRCVEFGTPTPSTPPPPPPPPDPCPARNIPANADSWLEQGSTSNKGDDSSLVVQSKNGQAFRALVRFPLPAAPPPGCVLDSAELRLYADGVTSGRTIQARRVATNWSETGVTWDSQPATTGAAASSSSGSAKGWRSWAVGPQVAEMYATGAAHGFLIRDAAEGDDAKQVYFSREKGQSVPMLVLRYRPGSPPEPDPEPEPDPDPPPPPPPPPACTSATVTSNADAWFEQGSTSNKGDDSSLVVQSKPGQAFRALVRFPLPAVPTGCVYDSAELRLYADGVTAGRTVEAQRIADPWSELAVTWDTQPAGAGAVAATSSGSDKGWSTWAVGPQVAEMYAAGAANGFVIRDAAEGDDAKQVYFSREKGESPPTLVVRFRAP